MHWKIHSQFLILSLISVTITSMGIMFYATQNWGIGVSPDSITYLDAGNSFYEQLTLTARGDTLTHYPPLYPILLAGTRLGTDDILTGARWLNILLLGGNVILVYWALLRVTSAQHWSLLGTTLFLAVSSSISVHLWAWTEPLFIFLTLATLLSWDLYLLRHDTMFLLGSAVLVSLATLTRYAGLFLVPAVVVTLLLDHRVHMRKKLVASSIFAFIGLLPVSVWLISTLLTGDGVANRTIALHVIGIERIEQGFRTISRWFIPDRVAMLLNKAGVLELMTGIGIVGLMYVALQGPGINQVRRRSFLLAIFSASLCAYVLFLLISISTFDAHTPLDSRILAPLIPFLVAFGVSIIQRCQGLGKTLRLVLYLALVAIFLVNIWETKSTILSTHATGLGYTGQNWASSELIGAVNGYSHDIPVYTNGNDVIYFYTGRVIQRIPAKYNPTSMQENMQYLEEMTEMSHVLGRGGGILIYFSGIRRQYLPSENELKEVLSLEEIYRTEEGAIYCLAP